MSVADAIVAGGAPRVVGGCATVRKAFRGKAGAKVEEFLTVGCGLGEPMKFVGNGAVPDIGVERLALNQSCEVNSLLFQPLR